MDDNRINKAKAAEWEDKVFLTRLLGCPSIDGHREEISRFRIRIGELAELNGEDWVSRNSQRLLAQWKLALKLDRQTRSR